MSINLGSNKIKNVRRGSSQVQRVYKGSTMVWPPQVTFDSIGGGSTGKKSSGGTWSWTHTVASDATAVVLWVGVTFTSTSQSRAATFGGVSMTQFTFDLFLTNNPFPFFTTYRYYIMGYVLMNPPTGTQTVNLTLTGGNVWVAANSVSYKNAVRYVTPTTSNISGASVSSITTNVASTIHSDMVSQAFSTSLAAGTGFSSYSQTQRQLISAVNDTNQPLIFGDAIGNDGTIGFTANHTGAYSAGAGVILRSMPL